MTESLRIGLAQFNITWENREANLLQVQQLLHFEEYVDLLILPEMWSTGFSMDPQRIAESHPGPALSWMMEVAGKHNLTIVGSLSVEEGGKYYNRLYFVHPEGHIDHYDKKHLFSYGKEDQYYTSGQQRTAVHIKGWKIMPIICYDLRFPAWCRNTVDYDLMIVVANWPTPRIHHWDTLLKARAIENQCYIAGVNRIGIDGNGLHYPGHSSIIDMNGIPLLEMKDKEEVGIMNLDREFLTQYREHFRFLQDRDDFQIIAGIVFVLNNFLIYS